MHHLVSPSEAVVMKSCLLALAMAVVAVVVLVPSLSEGRVFSRCELREKLLPRIIVPRGFKKEYKEQLLAVVICELTRLSKLNTSFVKVEGERVSATTATPTAPWGMPTDEVFTDEMPTEGTPTDETPTDEAFTDETPTDEAFTDEAFTDEVPTDEVPTDEAFTEEMPTEEMTPEEPAQTTPTTEATPWFDFFGEETTTEETPTTKTTKATTAPPMTSKTNTTEVVTTKATTRSSSSTPALAETTPQAGKKRRKRMVDELSPEHNWTLSELRMEAMVNMLKSNCDEWEIEEAEIWMRSEDSDGSEEGEYEGNQKPWSLGTYGVFQLSDGYFCDSGHRWSRNKCNTTCSAFTDDDITDDIGCLVRTGCWKKIFQGCDGKCLSVKNYFDGCK
ncbi:uncharacterized protein LOC117816187 [Notolabrus celidotus]|uniref:uncharacterized protein LOC117816187 n=1 Tax=Notolabrus celidotus TaxID=1203425 RepID=UPI001490479C|nr:uncharacterized protein LOC117816187 [Notolabrus celidotus]